MDKQLVNIPALYEGTDGVFDMVVAVAELGRVMQISMVGRFFFRSNSYGVKAALEGTNAVTRCALQKSTAATAYILPRQSKAKSKGRTEQAFVDDSSTRRIPCPQTCEAKEASVLETTHTFLHLNTSPIAHRYLQLAFSHLPDQARVTRQGSTQYAGNVSLCIRYSHPNKDTAHRVRTRR